jgi:hypothetical protein
MRETQSELDQALARVRAEQDLNVKALLLAGVVSELFRQRGFEPVVVGGSAIEFYTDGAYMSGDTDICWAGWPMPTVDERREIMAQIPGVEDRGGKSWCYDGIWVDLMGEVDYRAEKELVKFITPLGSILMIPVEDALVGRVYAARKYVSGFDEKDDDCAKKLMTAILSGSLPIDWGEALRVAASSKYNCVAELMAVRTEVEMELASSK